MDEETIVQYILENFDGVETTVIPGGTFFFLDPEKMFAFATLVTSDDFDSDSDLGRAGVYRLNMGVSKASFQSLFGDKPAGDEPARQYDYTVLDELVPHPIYGKMYWVSVLNPSKDTFEGKVKPLLTEAYERDAAKYRKKAG